MTVSENAVMSLVSKAKTHIMPRIVHTTDKMATEASRV
jgi:hypothetical protein